MIKATNNKCNTGEKGKNEKRSKKKTKGYTLKKYIAYRMLLQPIYLFMVGCFCRKKQTYCLPGDKSYPLSLLDIQNWELGLVLDCLQDGRA